jgi:hypothetical protein
MTDEGWLAAVLIGFMMFFLPAGWLNFYPAGVG